MTDITSDTQVLAATIWGESRGEPLLGQQAVASVILNRARSAVAHPRHQFGDGTIKGACLAPWQFSSWNHSDPNREKMLALDMEAPDRTLQRCISVADEAVSGNLEDPTGGATFYKVTTLAWPSEWGPQVPPCEVIGHQSFYKLP